MGSEMCIRDSNTKYITIYFDIPIITVKFVLYIFREVLVVDVTWNTFGHGGRSKVSEEREP